VLVAIDGPAGSGKSTVARALAQELGFTYMDSGAMYRCVALAWLAAPLEEPAALARAAAIELVPAPSGGPCRVLLDGVEVSDAIRTPQVSEAASRVACDEEVRSALVARQRELLEHGDWVAEGRDIGTVVAPQAAVKVFLTADARERARRRAQELGAEQAMVAAEQAMRDERDSTRAHSPLRAAPGAVTLDTTGLGVEAVVSRIAVLVAAARERG